MRYRSVDALRGLAAVIVLIHHCVLVYEPGGDPWALGSLLRYTPLRLLADGPGAVLIFFVVSGFSLAASIESARARFDYPHFAVARVLRIYPPFAVAILCSAALCVFLRPQPIDDLSEWFNTQSWAYPVTPGLIAGHLLMTDQHRDMTLLNAMWALIHILRISLIFPPIYFALEKRPIAATIALAALSAGANWALSRGGLAPLAQTLCGTAQYVVVFAFGALIFRARVRLGRLMTGKKGVLSLAALALGAGLFLAPRDLPVLAIWIPAAGAALLLMLAIASPTAAGALDNSVCGWLGAISYSLYLVHLPVLLTVFHLGAGAAPAWALYALTAAGALGAAELMRRYVETPALALSRRARTLSET